MSDTKTRDEWKVARLRATLQSLQSDARQAIDRKRNKGGQHVGMPAFAGCSVRALLQIERDCRHALEESEGDLEWFKKYYTKEAEATLQQARARIVELEESLVKQGARYAVTKADLLTAQKRIVELEAGVV